MKFEDRRLRSRIFVLAAVVLTCVESGEIGRLASLCVTVCVVVASGTE